MKCKLVLMLGLMVNCSIALAANYEWVGTGSSAWETASNWNLGNKAPNMDLTNVANDGAYVLINGGTVGRATALTMRNSALELKNGARLNVTGAVYVGNNASDASTLTVDNSSLNSTSSFTITGTSTATINKSSVNASTATVGANGTLLIQDSNVTTTTTFAVSAGGTLTVSGNSKLTIHGELTTKYDAAAPSVITINGGEVLMDGNASFKPYGTVNLYGGSLSVTRVTMQGTGVLNIFGGTFTILTKGSDGRTSITLIVIAAKIMLT